MINFHYRRENEDYAGWRLHVYARGSRGRDYTFEQDPNHPGYMVARVPEEDLGTNTKKLWFKIHKDYWKELDGKTNRSIRMEDFPNENAKDVFLRGNERVKHFRKPELNHAVVKLHYFRHDGDYTGWTANTFVDVRNNNQRIVRGFDGWENDGLFKKTTMKIDLEKGAKNVNCYMRSPTGYDLIDPRSIPATGGEINAYIVQDEPKVFLDRAEAMKSLEPKILKTSFYDPGENNCNFNKIFVELNKALPEHMIRNVTTFDVVDKYGHHANILSASYTDRTRRRIEITIRDFEAQPFENHYRLKIHTNDPNFKFKDPSPISINRLFDRREFNERYVWPSLSRDTKFGANYTNDRTDFALWAPTAENVRVLVYNYPVEGTPVREFDMSYSNGTWNATVRSNEVPDMEGKFYTYEVTEAGKKREVVDPYAKALGVNAQRGVIIDLEKTNPLGWKNHARPKGFVENPVIYEMSIRDFTSGKGSDVKEWHQGKFVGVAEKINHLKRLGIDCIQLLPVTKFESDETKPFGGSYNWGYDQKGFWFVPEGSYSTRPDIPGTRIREFKEMVKACHENGIRVIIDAVHNHTYETEKSPLNKVVNGYYYRQDWDESFHNGSGCGNETKSERPMAGRLIRDYLSYWANEMGVDGFRFDLMSLTDKYTMQQIRKDMDKISPDIMLYGEAYTMGWTNLPRHMQSSKENMNGPELDRIGAFTDVGSRNAVRGYNDEPGLATGAPASSWNSRVFYVGQKGEFIDLPSRNNDTRKAINYIDVHDDLLAIDMLKQPQRNMSKQEQVKRYKLAYSMLMNYIGPVLIKSGAEGIITKHGDYNSYKTEEVNLINWNRMLKHDDMVRYFSEYIRFRRNHPAFMMSRGDMHSNFEVLDSHYGNIKGKMFKNHANGDPFNKLLVYHNIDRNDLYVDLPKENSGWAVICDETTAGNWRLGNVVRDRVKVPALSTLVLGDNESVEKAMHRDMRLGYQKRTNFFSKFVFGNKKEEPKELQLANSGLKQMQKSASKNKEPETTI